MCGNLLRQAAPENGTAPHQGTVMVPLGCGPRRAPGGGPSRGTQDLPLSPLASPGRRGILWGLLGSPAWTSQSSLLCSPPPQRAGRKSSVLASSGCAEREGSGPPSAHGVLQHPSATLGLVPVPPLPVGDRQGLFSAPTVPHLPSNPCPSAPLEDSCLVWNLGCWTLLRFFQMCCLSSNLKSQMLASFIICSPPWHEGAIPRSPREEKGRGLKELWENENQHVVAQCYICITHVCYVCVICMLYIACMCYVCVFIYVIRTYTCMCNTYMCYICNIRVIYVQLGCICLYI